MQSLETMKEISALQLEKLENVHILDVRRVAEYEDGAICGSINIPHARLLDRLSDLDKDTEWVVNCHTGIRSAAACMILKQNGYSVTNLAGGYKGWKEHVNCSMV
jgi:hydroxyacylglutathione hydrolase